MIGFDLALLSVTGIVALGFSFYSALVKARASRDLRREKEYVLTEAVQVLASVERRRNR